MFIKKYIVLLSFILLTGCQIQPPTKIEGEIVFKLHEGDFSDYYSPTWVKRCSDNGCFDVLVDDQKVIYHQEKYIFVVRTCTTLKAYYVSKVDYDSHLIGDFWQVPSYIKCVPIRAFKQIRANT